MRLASWLGSDAQSSASGLDLQLLDKGGRMCVQVSGKGRTITEVEVDEYLTGRRVAQPGFVETSFPTIAGADGNGAIIHYRAEPETCATVGSNTLLLLDSGKQHGLLLVWSMPAALLGWGASYSVDVHSAALSLCYTLALQVSTGISVWRWRSRVGSCRCRGPV